MKRSAALVPLSRDHHTALVVARELCRSTEANAQAAATRYVEFLRRHELEHFAVEEAVLLSAMPDGPGARGFDQHVRADHDYLRAALRRLEEEGSAPSVALLHEIGARLREHVRFEEREVFAYIERELNAATLAALGARIAERERTPPAQ